MTRWARANNVHKARPSEPTPWTELRTAQTHQNRGNTAQQSEKERGSRREGGVEERESKREGGVEERESKREGGVEKRDSKREGGVEDKGGRRDGSVDERESKREGGMEDRGSRRDGGVEEDRGSSRRDGGVEDRGSRRKGGVDVNVDDVNGFMEYLKRTGQPLSHRSAGALDPGEDAFATFLRKDQKREKRRVKRLQSKSSSMVCFNCRKPGHGLADCPEADGDEELGRGICYRCGSTEHELQRCRAKVDPALGDYPYAKCFICGQTGHLSRSCPDNPKGLYAAGGCCHVCGSVEHFQKDCPEHQNSGNSITLRRLSNQISADQEDVHVSVKRPPAKKTKIVMF